MPGSENAHIVRLRAELEKAEEDGDEAKVERLKAALGEGKVSRAKPAVDATRDG